MNDGKGLFDNEGLCDTIKQDLNSLIKLAMNGQYILACSLVASIAVRLENLKKGIKSDSDSQKEKIEELKRQIDSLLKEKDGGSNGTD
ncbi:MAG: hypothetical protein J6W10_05220 [Kiritimatiellae bacterium]|nr:hypothetical protein [Kiritimatiellia bacterium]